MATQKKPLPKTFNFRYVKNHDFRTVSINGAYGGITGRGLININFYTDLVTVPKVVTHSVLPNGGLGEMVAADTPQEGTREVPFGILIDIQSAKNIHDWFGKKIQEAEVFYAENQKNLDSTVK